VSAIGELARELRERLVEDARDLPHSLGGDQPALGERVAGS
jgi:hypothetical protein